MANTSQDSFQQARERYDDAREAMRENRQRMEEDLEFSNPAEPKQWEVQSVTDRKGRPTLTMDNTNQFIQQVVNDGRRNTPSIQTIPEDSGANVQVSQQLNGRIRHIEYASRAGAAYDTSLEYSTRIGIGWIRVMPKLVDGPKNYQEPRIYGCDDPLAACIDGDSIEFDGSDAMFGFYETVMSKRAFERRWPKARSASFSSADGDWFDAKGIRVCQYWRVIEKPFNNIVVAGPDGGTMNVTEEQYWETAKKTGVKPEPIDTFWSKERTVKFATMSGVDFLEETDFPSKWIGLIPVYGHVLRVKGKRYICGLTRRLRDGQRFHNYEMSSLAETLLSQPKAPFMAPARAIEGYEQHWQQLNDGNPAYLPYNDIDDSSEVPIAPPIRLAPPMFPAAFANAANLGLNEMQASVGMYKSTLGQQSNAVSGRAKQADKVEGDNATFNFHDNLRRSLEQVGRVVVDMDIRLNDTARDVRVLGMNADSTNFVRVDPEMKEPVKVDARGKVTSFNPGIGEYGIVVKTGPSYATQREELEDRLTQLGQGNPQLAAALAPLLVKMADMPDADKVARICLSLLPPPVQQAYNEDDDKDAIPPAVKQQMQGMQQSLQQASEMIQKLAAELNAAHDENAEKQRQAEMEAAQESRKLDIEDKKTQIEWYRAETDRIAAAAAASPVTPEAVAEINEILAGHGEAVQALLQAHMQTQGQLAALTNAHADLHDNVMPPEVPEQQVPPADPSQLAVASDGMPHP